jgi:hypothetical protein
METTIQPSMASRDGVTLSVQGLGVSVLLPLGGYYLLRLAGLEPFTALVITTAVSAVGTARQVARTRNLLSLDAAMLLFTLAAIGQGLIHGNPRFLLAVDSGLTGLGRVWFLLTARTERPLGFVIARALLERRFRMVSTLLGRGYRLTPESWASLWDRSAAFRRIWRISTAVWGLGSVADAVIRLVMAMTLPVDAVPGLNAILYPATFIVLQVVTNVYYHRAGLWTILRASDGTTVPATA